MQSPPSQASAAATIGVSLYERGLALHDRKKRMLEEDQKAIAAATRATRSPSFRPSSATSPAAGSDAKDGAHTPHTLPLYVGIYYTHHSRVQAKATALVKSCLSVQQT